MMDLEKQVAELEAIGEIQNLMGAYSFYLDGRKYDEILELFSRREDTWVDLGGVYRGREGLERLYPGKHYDEVVRGRYPGYRGRGNVAKHPQNTPLVVVAEDGMTARGLWTSLGFAAFFLGGPDSTMFVQGMFRYAADFILEDGAWRIWHMVVCNGIGNVSGVPLPPPPGGGEPQAEEDHRFDPDEPSPQTFHYDDDARFPYWPRVPADFPGFDLRERHMEWREEL